MSELRLRIPASLQAALDAAAARALLRFPVGQVYPGTEPGVLFLDTFEGGGDLSTHTPVPNLGNYELLAGDAGALTDLALDAGGGLLLEDSSAGKAYRAWTPITALPADYVMEAVIRIDSFGAGGFGFIDFVMWLSGPDVFLVEMLLQIDGPGDATLKPYVDPIGGGSGSDSVALSTITTVGVEHTLTAEVSAAAVLFKVDGVLASTIALGPDVTPDRVIVHAEGRSGMTGVLKSVRVYTAA